MQPRRTTLRRCAAAISLLSVVSSSLAAPIDSHHGRRSTGEHFGQAFMVNADGGDALNTTSESGFAPIYVGAADDASGAMGSAAFQKATGQQSENPKGKGKDDCQHTATSSAVPTSTPSSSPTGSSRKAPMVAAYFPDWSTDIMPPEKVNFTKFDLLDYAFAIPDEKFNLVFTGWDSENVLRRLVTYAHGNDTKVMVSIGGWTGSKYFSSAVKNDQNRQVFAKNIANLITKFNLDGIDLDWEYPGTSGNYGNIVSSSDSDNLLSFLKLLRTTIGDKKRISMCATHHTFVGSDGQPIPDVSEYAKLLNSVLVMNYDVWGASSNPGPNAPFNNTCGNSQQPQANEVSAVQLWTDAGMPASKIMMGIPAYGYVISTSKSSLSSKRKRSLAAWAEDGWRKRAVRDRQAMLRRRGAPEVPTYTNDAVSNVAASPIDQNATYIRAPSSDDTNSATGEEEEDTATELPSGSSFKAQTKLNKPITGQDVTGSDGSSDGSSGSSDGGDGVFNPDGDKQVNAAGNGDLSQFTNSQANFATLINNGALVRKSDGSFTGKNGYQRKWDTCSSTPYLVNSNSNIVVTYDDPQSLAIKAAYAQTAGLAGLNMWSIDGDYQWALTNAVRNAMGLS